MESVSDNIEHISISVIPESQTAAEGSTADFRCLALGFPAPDVRWTRVDGALPPNHAVRGGRLYLQRVTSDAAGQYVCTASNTAGVAEKTVRLNVQGRLCVPLPGSASRYYH